MSKKTPKNSPNQSSSLNVANSKCSQHNLAHQWRAVESDGVEVSWRKGIYSILIVGGGRVAGEAFQHFQFYLRVERGCWFCSFSRTKLPWRQQRPKAEEIYECWKRKTEWVQLSIIWNIALPGRYIKQASVPTMCAERHSHVMLRIIASVRFQCID